MRRLILFLIRLKLGVKKYERFRFTNQKTKDIYYIDEFSIDKTYIKNRTYHIEPSGVSLNWLLDPCCEIEKIEVKE